MFEFAMSGVNAYEIARMLNSDMIPTKSQYKKLEKGYKTWDTVAVDFDNAFWTDTSVRKVIQDEVYIGTVISGKFKRPSIGNKKIKSNPKSEWICVPDMHEPIVTKEEFARADKMIRMPRRNKTVPKERYLYAKVRCHCCNRSLIRWRGKSPIYFCETPKFKPSPDCVTEPVSELQIEEALLSAIKAQATSVIDMDKARIRKNEQIAERKQELQKAARRYEGSVNNLTSVRQDYYEKLKDDEISRDEYFTQRDSINEQIEILNAKTEEAKTLIAECDALMSDMAHVADEWHNALDIESLSKELVDVLVDSIIVYDSEHIEIHWKFAYEYAAS
jgi:hypothetical protein